MNTFGQLFRISIFGESHGAAVGVMIDGCPPGIKIDSEEIECDLDRRRSGARGTTPRMEYDRPEIISGVLDGYTTGAPVMVMTTNTSTRSGDYDNLKHHPRPGHADMVVEMKYGGYGDRRGGGHFSGRLTWGLVVAGTLAKRIIAPAVPEAVLISAGGNSDINAAVSKALEEGDSIGGLIECRVKEMPVSLGEPFFWSAESAVSQIVFSIPAIKGIEFGSGFRAASMRGSEHNDMITGAGGETSTNNAGGINGGITNGNDLVFRVAVKPTSSISRPQQSLNMESGRVETLIVEGRHDACIALRMPVIVESAVAVALADLLLMNRGIHSNVQKNG